MARGTCETVEAIVDPVRDMVVLPTVKLRAGMRCGERGGRGFGGQEVRGKQLRRREGKKESGKRSEERQECRQPTC